MWSHALPYEIADAFSALSGGVERLVGFGQWQPKREKCDARASQVTAAEAAPLLAAKYAANRREHDAAKKRAKRTTPEARERDNASARVRMAAMRARRAT
jgi:hypothetical protein